MAKTYGEFLKQFIKKVEDEAGNLSQYAEDREFEEMFAVVSKMEDSLCVIKEFCEAHIAETKKSAESYKVDARPYREDTDDE